MGGHFSMKSSGISIVSSRLGSLKLRGETGWEWLKYPKANHLGWSYNLVNNGINYQPQLVHAGFLNHQQYVYLWKMQDQTKNGP